MKNLVLATLNYLNLSYTRCADLNDFLNRYAIALDDFVKAFSSSLYGDLDKQQIIADFTAMMNTDMRARPQGAAPLFDAIFYTAYATAASTLKQHLYDYLNNPNLPSEDVTALYNGELDTIIPLSLQNQVTLLFETVKINNINPTQPPASEVFQQLSTLSNDISTSQVCIDLKNYVLSIPVNDITASKS